MLLHIFYHVFLVVWILIQTTKAKLIQRVVFKSNAMDEKYKQGKRIGSWRWTWASKTNKKVNNVFEILRISKVRLINQEKWKFQDDKTARQLIPFAPLEISFTKSLCLASVGSLFGFLFPFHNLLSPSLAAFLFVHMHYNSVISMPQYMVGI
jgi:hypothetical protein